MSLRGRYIIERIKTAVSKRVTLPVPPYEIPAYWNNAYKGLGVTDVYEWGAVNYKDDLSTFDYQSCPVLSEFCQERLLAETPPKKRRNAAPSMEYHDLAPQNWFSKPVTSTTTTTFGDAIHVHPHDIDKPILLLGCGTSDMGDEMVDVGYGRTSPIRQVDVAARVVSLMSNRWNSLSEIARRHKLNQDAANMEFVEDDATVLTAFGDESVNAIVDKGLIDALFCANAHTQINHIMETMHRVLRPGGVFLFVSFSRPEFLIGSVAGIGRMDAAKITQKQKRPRDMWNEIDVRLLPSIFMYRFVKRLTPPEEDVPSSSQKPKRKKQFDRRLLKKIRSRR